MYDSIFSKASENETENTPQQPPLMAWTSQLSVGVRQLDEDHKRLAHLISELAVSGRAKAALEVVFDALLESLRLHMAHEEQLFARSGYPDAAAHHAEHEFLLEVALDLQARFLRSTRPEQYREIASLLKERFLGHMQSTDPQYAPHLRAKFAETILSAPPSRNGISRADGTNGDGI